MQNSDSEIEKLIQAVLDGVASEAERERFQSMLKSNPEFRKQYIQQSSVNALLAWQSGKVGPAAEKNLNPPLELADKHRSNFRRTAIAAAAVVLLSLALFSYWRSQQSFKIDVLAADTKYRAGETLHTDHLEIDRGVLRVKLPSDAVVELSGASSIDLKSDNHLQLEDGDITIDSDGPNDQIVVETKEVRITDIGTRFHVGHHDNVTIIDVYSGVVVVHKAGQPESPQSMLTTLTAGKSVRINSNYQITQLP